MQTMVQLQLSLSLNIDRILAKSLGLEELIWTSQEALLRLGQLTILLSCRSAGQDR